MLLVQVIQDPRGFCCENLAYASNRKIILKRIFSSITLGKRWLILGFINVKWTVTWLRTLVAMTTESFSRKD